MRGGCYCCGGLGTGEEQYPMVKGKQGRMCSGCGCGVGGVGW